MRYFARKSSPLAADRSETNGVDVVLLLWKIAGMSYIFDDPAGQTLWSPASNVGQLYVCVAQQLSESLNRPHGLVTLANDWFQVQPDVLTEFVVAVLEGTSHHLVYRDLVRGFVRTTLVLLRRSAVGLDQVTSGYLTAGELSITEILDRAMAA